MALRDNTALITGISGQDGAYLAKELLEDGYKVIGIIRIGQHDDFWRLKYLGIRQDVELVQCDQLSLDSCKKMLIEYHPSEVYHLAAESSVSNSFKKPIETLSFNIISTINWLEAIKTTETGIRFYHASSSEMYGMVNKLPVSHETPFHPLSPYAISKASGHWTVNNYRESYGLFTSCGILFNHESYLRPSGFFVKKVLRGALQISRNQAEVLRVGNIDIRRDFGYAPEYVKAIKLILRHDSPDNFQVCSGTSVELRKVIHHVFDRLNINHERIFQDPSLYRPTDIHDIYGDNATTKRVLNWSYHLNFFDVLDIMLNEEINNYSLTDSVRSEYAE